MRFKPMTQFAIYLLLTSSLLVGCAIGPAPSKSADKKPSAEATTPANRLSPEQRQKFRGALADIQSGALDDARKALESLTQQHSGLAAAHNNLAVVYRRQGNFDKAKSAYQAALRAEPDNRNAHLNLGILYDVYLQQPAQALPHYEQYQSLSTQPDKEVALWIADLKRRL